MERRAFVAGSLGVLAAPLAAEAQQAGRVPRVGILGSGTNPRTTPFFVAFEQRLQELGYIDGQTIVIDFRFPRSPQEFSELAVDLVRQKTDVILAAGPEEPLRAARQATTTIPIVMVALNYDPIARGHIASLARPGRNVTGIFFQTPEVNSKQLALLAEALPKRSRLAVVWDSLARDQLPAIESAAALLHVELQKVEVVPPYDFERAFAEIRRRGAHGVLVAGSPVMFREQQRIGEAALRHRLPTMGSTSFAPHLLLGYGPPLADTFRRAAEYVDKILKGAKPADLPVEQPTKFELVINLKLAKALSLTIPPSLLARADAVIQ
jgi:putative tryptophan/tyrosine transport system substrate-binding protein